VSQVLEKQQIFSSTAKFASIQILPMSQAFAIQRMRPAYGTYKENFWMIPVSYILI
jgi:hypothetical protein